MVHYSESRNRETVRIFVSKLVGGTAIWPWFLAGLRLVTQKFVPAPTECKAFILPELHNNAHRYDTDAGRSCLANSIFDKPLHIMPLQFQPRSGVM